MIMPSDIWHSILHYTGSSNPSGVWYGWWSGFAGDLPILVGLLIYWRRHNCHVRRCPLVTWKEYDGHMLCRLHHPDNPPRASNIAA